MNIIKINKPYNNISITLKLTWLFTLIIINALQNAFAYFM